MPKTLKTGFLQALGLAAYISLVAWILNNAEQLFGSLDEQLAGPIVFLTLMSISALVCGLIALGYPAQLFWVKKQPAAAISVVGYTTLFLVLFFALVLSVALLSR